MTEFKANPTPPLVTKEYKPPVYCKGKSCRSFIKCGGHGGKVKGKGNVGKCKEQNNIVVYADSSLCPLGEE